MLSRCKMPLSGNQVQRRSSNWVVANLLLHYNIHRPNVKGILNKIPEKTRKLFSPFFRFSYWQKPGRAAPARRFVNPYFYFFRGEREAAWTSQAAFSPQHERSAVLEWRHALFQWERLVQAVVLSDGNPTAIWPGEARNLYAGYWAEDILTPVFGIQERNFAFVTLVIKIVVHGWTFQLVKKKIVWHHPQCRLKRDRS